MKYAFVTGGANGIGRQITSTLVNLNYTVFVGDVDEKGLEALNGENNIVPLKVDITDEASLNQALECIMKTTNKLDVVINNAGVTFMQTLIESDVDKIAWLLNINLLGMIRVNKIMFPLIQNGNGRIINISSECGWMKPAPFNGPYTISKHAVEAYNDTLRRELNYLGIKVIKIQPGSFKTKIHEATLNSYYKLKDSTVLYKDIIGGMEETMKRELENANDMKYLMEAITDAVTSDTPKICYQVKNSEQLSKLSLLSDEELDRIYMGGK